MVWVAQFFMHCLTASSPTAACGASHLPAKRTGCQSRPQPPRHTPSHAQELAGMFERLVAALAGGDVPGAADAALRFAYYWWAHSAGCIAFGMGAAKCARARDRVHRGAQGASLPLMAGVAASSTATGTCAAAHARKHRNSKRHLRPRPRLLSTVPAGTISCPWPAAPPSAAMFPCWAPSWRPARPCGPRCPRREGLGAGSAGGGGRGGHGMAWHGMAWD